jgi:hypothetical protein
MCVDVRQRHHDPDAVDPGDGVGFGVGSDGQPRGPLDVGRLAGRIDYVAVLFSGVRRQSGRHLKNKPGSQLESKVSSGKTLAPVAQLDRASVYGWDDRTPRKSLFIDVTPYAATNSLPTIHGSSTPPDHSGHPSWVWPHPVKPAEKNLFC